MIVLTGDNQQTSGESRGGELTEDRTTKIFCFVEGRYGNGDVVVCALDEHGLSAGSHLSSSIAWARRDIGVTDSFVAKRRYSELYPNGFELEWIDEEKLDTHAGFLAAYALNQAIPDDAATDKQLDEEAR